MKILITGGASGLGEAMTRRFAQAETNTVYFTYNASADRAKKISAQLKNTKGLACDFGDRASLNRLIENLPSMDPDLLIINAHQGKFIDTYFHKTSLEDFSKGFETNILSSILIAQNCLEIFRKKKAGAILTVLSAALTTDPPIGSSVYTATKAYLEQLSKCWAMENKKFNIVSGAVSPALMLTSMTRQLDERLLEQLKENSPGKEFLSTEAAAAIIFQLIKDPARLNGKNIPIDTGTTLN